MKIKHETRLELMPDNMAAELNAAGDNANLRHDIFTKHCNNPNRAFFFLRGQWTEESIRRFVKRHRPSFKGIVRVEINKLFISKVISSVLINKFTIEV